MPFFNLLGPVFLTLLLPFSCILVLLGGCPAGAAHLAAQGEQARTADVGVSSEARLALTGSRRKYLEVRNRGRTGTGKRPGTGHHDGQSRSNHHQHYHHRTRGGVASAGLIERSQAKRLSENKERPKGEPPVPPLSTPDENTPISVNMASFLDGARCARTVNWALQKAKNPHRLSFSVLQAKRKTDVDCADEFEDKYIPNLCKEDGRFSHLGKGCFQQVRAKLKVWTIDPMEGKGPAHQRGLANELFELDDRDDKFCLDIDAHMDFRPNWDTTMVDDWVSTGNEFAVLTAYPLAMADAAKGGSMDNTWIDLCGFSLENGIPRGKTAGTMFKNEHGPPEGPFLTLNWAAGQSFQRCHADRNVPVDPNLKWIFTGEEVDRAVRFWTHGYDLYLPMNTAILHDYGHSVQTFWSFDEPEKPKEEQESRKRLFTLLDIGNPLHGEAGKKLLGQYGIGGQRTLEEYIKWSKEDWGGHWTEFLKESGGAVDPGPDFCKSLPRLPVKDRAALIASAKSQNRESGTRSLAQTEAFEAGAIVEK